MPRSVNPYLSSKIALPLILNIWRVFIVIDTIFNHLRMKSLVNLATWMWRFFNVALVGEEEPTADINVSTLSECQ